MALRSVPNPLAQADAAMHAGDFVRAAATLDALARANPQDAGLWLRLAAARRGARDVPGALDAASVAVRQAPDLLAGHLMRVSLLEALGRHEDAIAAARDALRCAAALGNVPTWLDAQIARARAVVAAEDASRRRVAAVAITGSGDDRRALAVFRDNILRGPAPDGAPEQFAYPGLAEATFLDPAAIPGIAALEADTDAIRCEFEALIAARVPELVSMFSHVRGSQADAVGGAGRWSSLPLIADGDIVEANARFAPHTLSRYLALDPPSIAGRSPNLMFSLLDPGAHIPPHRGLTNTRLVLHLPLIVPDGCGLRVGSETRAWHVGQALLFDDTVDHEAWNKGRSIRVVLLGDLWRPELSAAARSGIAAMMARGPDVVEDGAALPTLQRREA